MALCAELKSRNRHYRLKCTDGIRGVSGNSIDLEDNDLPLTSSIVGLNRNRAGNAGSAMTSQCLTGGARLYIDEASLVDAARTLLDTSAWRSALGNRR